MSIKLTLVLKLHNITFRLLYFSDFSVMTVCVVSTGDILSTNIVDLGAS